MYVTWREILSLPEPAVITTDMEETWELTNCLSFKNTYENFGNVEFKDIASDASQPF